MMETKNLFRLCAAAFLVGCLGAVVQGEVDSYSLLVQQSPADAGVVSPDAGIHRIRTGDAVTLQAVAKPGYRFLYWLGDVSDSSTNQAVVVLDAPKIVVAVFGRMEYELMVGGGASVAEESQASDADIRGSSFAAGGGAGGNTLTASAGYTGGGAVGGGRPPGGGAGSKLRTIPVIIDDDDIVGPGDTDDDDDDDMVVPGGDPPNETPEPATIALLGIGAVLFLRRRSR